jgi:hypothetical protein
MKQTAVEWQFEQLFNSFEKFNNGECTFNEFLKRNLEIREQAKEMEYERMVEIVTFFDDRNSNPNDIRINVEQYYNEKFNK